MIRIILLVIILAFKNKTIERKISRNVKKNRFALI